MGLRSLASGLGARSNLNASQDRSGTPTKLRRSAVGAYLPCRGPQTGNLRRSSMSRIITSLVASALVFAPIASRAAPPSGTAHGVNQASQPQDVGQPNASCEDAAVFP